MCDEYGLNVDETRSELHVFEARLEAHRKQRYPTPAPPPRFGVKERWQFLRKCSPSSILPNVLKLYTALLTLAVTVASNERSFSCLRRVKNYLRSTMGQERLSSLGILAIEPDLVNQLDLDALIDDFKKLANHRIDL